MPLISEAIRAELMRAYAAPDRHYHNLGHIEALLRLARQHRGALADPDVVRHAITALRRAFGNEEAACQLERLKDDPNEDVRAAVRDGLKRIRRRR